MSVATDSAHEGMFHARWNLPGRPHWVETLHPCKSSLHSLDKEIGGCAIESRCSTQTYVCTLQPWSAYCLLQLLERLNFSAILRTKDWRSFGVEEPPA